jgi:hypothetical protein
VICRLKGRSPHHQLVDSCAERPKIHSFVIPSALKHLGCPVKQRPRDCEHVDLSAPVQHFATNPKIDYLHHFLLLVVENVLRLDVPVANALRMDIGQRLQNLIHDLFQLLHKQALTCSVCTPAWRRSGKGT